VTGLKWLRRGLNGGLLWTLWHFLRDRKFLDQMSEYQSLQKDSAKLPEWVI
jgi:hypothetical protein